MALIPERVWEMLSEEERDALQAAVDGFRHQPTFCCPSCQAEVAVKLKVSFGKVALEAAREKTPAAYVFARSHVDLRVLEAAKTSGLMNAFVSTVKAEKEFAGVPSDMDEFFLEFFKKAATVDVPCITLTAWADEFGGRIEVWGHQGILAILSDGTLRAFFPKRLTEPVAVSGKGPRPKVSNEASFALWTKGRFGYVPAGAGAFGQALRQKNIGKFGALVQ